MRATRRGQSGPRGPRARQWRERRGSKSKLSGSLIKVTFMVLIASKAWVGVDTFSH
jgi:hypothetical protein